MDRTKTDLKKFHFIYKTTNLLNGRYYVGLHSTDVLEDDYIGSGKRLWNEVNKYGRENFKREIVEFLPSRKELKARERSLVNEEMLKDPLCINLKLGGEGGWESINALYCSKKRSVYGKVNMTKMWSENYDRLLSIIGERSKILQQTGILKPPSFKDKSHSTEARLAIGEANSKMTGEKNSQFGSKWMNKDGAVKKVKHDEIQHYRLDGWNFGRSIRD